jgi:hypothetical protein
MWQKKIKKTIFTLNIDNYEEKITELTYPLLKRYAKKIDADFYIISERKFPDYPPVYEKLQIYKLAQEMENDWNIYIDSDALVHPDFFDITNHLQKDTVAHNGVDMAGNRWKYDRFFRRDGRHLSSCNWFSIASDWCIDLWKPLDDLTLEEATENITPIVSEVVSGLIPASHLIDDYVLSRNIAKFGLKFTTINQIVKDIGDTGNYLWHQYLLSSEDKIMQMKEILNIWKI